MRILYVQPTNVPDSGDRYEHLIEEVRGPNTTVDVRCLDYQPVTVTLPKEPLYLAPLFETVKQANRDGFDAVIIACYSDPGQREAQLISCIPVFGAMQLGVRAAQLLGHRVGILCPSKKGRRTRPLAWHWDSLFRYGVAEYATNLYTVDCEGVPAEVAAELLEQQRYDELNRRLAKSYAKGLLTTGVTVVQNAIAQDEIDVVLPACTIWSGQAAQLSEQVGIPVVDPFQSLIVMAEAALRVYAGGQRS